MKKRKSAVTNQKSTYLYKKKKNLKTQKFNNYKHYKNVF